MQINLGGMIQGSLSAEQKIGSELMAMMKAYGLTGSGFENLSLMDIFGAPGHSSVGTSALRDVETLRGWNFTAVMAKALQFSIGNMSAYCPQWMAEAIADKYGEEYKASKRVTGIEQYNVPEDWVVAPRRHRISKLLNEPNPWTDAATFFLQIAFQTDIHGVATILVLPEEGNGLPKQMWVIPKAGIHPQAPSAKFPEGSYRTGHLSKLSINTYDNHEDPRSLQEMLARLSNREFSAKYVIPLGISSPVYYDDFLNPSSAISDTLDTDTQLHRSRRAMLEKMMATGPRLEPMPGVTVSNTEWVKIMEEFESQNMGPDKAGNPWRNPAGIKVTDDSHTGREMEFVNSADQSRDHTLGQRLTSAAMLGLGEGGSYAQVIGLIKGNARMVLQPLMRIYSGQLSIGLRRFFEHPQSEFMTIMQCANIDDPEQKMREWGFLKEAGAVKVGEVRNAFNLMPFGDENDDKIAGATDQQGGADQFGGSQDTGDYGNDYADESGNTDSGEPETPGVGNPEAESTASLKTAAVQSASSTMSRRDFMRHHKNIMDVVTKYKDGVLGEKTASLMLESLGLQPDKAQEFINSVKDPGAEQTMSAAENQTTATALFARMAGIKGGTFKSIVDDQAMTAATHPENHLKQPTEKEAKAGVYRKGKLRLCGMQIEIENPVGSIRSGRRQDGSRWTVDMQDHYGYIVGATGFDKDQLDIFVRQGTEPTYDGPVFVINQSNEDGSFDEHKCFIGCASKLEAIKRYLDNYDDDWADRILSVTELSIPQFKDWMLDADGGPMTGELAPDDALKYMSIGTGGMTAEPLSVESVLGGAFENEMAKSANTETVSAYGYCPKCGAETELRERRINGNDVCFNKHTYPSKNALKSKPVLKSVAGGFFKAKSERDGDGDGLVNDGTPQERPVGYDKNDKNVRYGKPKWDGTKVDKIANIPNGAIERHQHLIQTTFPNKEQYASTVYNTPIRRMTDYIKNHGEKGKDYELKFVDVNKVKLTQDGEDYSNDSSKYTAQTFADLKKGKEKIRELRQEDLDPIILDSHGFVRDGNHRHAAHRMTGSKQILALVPVDGGVVGKPKIRNVEEFHSSLAKPNHGTTHKSISGGFFKAITEDELRNIPNKLEQDNDDPQEKAELIADILTSIYGDEAEALISDGDDAEKLASAFGKAFGGAGMFKEARTRRGGSRRAQGGDIRDADGDGMIYDGTPQERPVGVRPQEQPARRSRARNTPERIAEIHSQVDRALKGDRSPKSAKELADSLSSLTVRQLHDLKKKFDMKASGRTKKELVDKIAKRLDSGRRMRPEDELSSRRRQAGLMPTEEPKGEVTFSVIDSEDAGMSDEEIIEAGFDAGLTNQDMYGKCKEATWPDDQIAAALENSGFDDNKIVSFFAEAGLSDAQIYDAVDKNGWNDERIEDAYKTPEVASNATDEPSPVTPVNEVVEEESKPLSPAKQKTREEIMAAVHDRMSDFNASHDDIDNWITDDERAVLDKLDNHIEEPQDVPDPPSPPENSESVSIFDEPVGTDPTPDAVASAEAEQVVDASATDSQYEFARATAVSNAGEDLKLSKRHIANAWKTTLDTATDDQRALLLTKANMQRNEPHLLGESFNPEDGIDKAMTHAAAAMALNKFPGKVYDGNFSGTLGDDARKNNQNEYVESWRILKSAAERIAVESNSPQDVITKMRAEIGKRINDLRENSSRYNNHANQLVDMSRSLTTNAYKKTGTGAQLIELMQLRMQPDPTLFNKAVSGVLQNKTIAASLGVKSETSGRKKPSSIYDKMTNFYNTLSAERVGGREITVGDTPDSLSKHLVENLGFRGVQHGNYVPDDERIAHMRHTANACADLLDVTGLREKDVTFGGKLGIAFGARGNAGALAHYEPTTEVVALTRHGGSGALAHEWGHFFDHMVGSSYEEKNGSKNPIGKDSPYMMSDKASGSDKYYAQVPQEDGTYKWQMTDRAASPVRDAMKSLQTAFKESGYSNRLRTELSKARREGMSPQKQKYWGSEKEVFARTFEAWVQHSLESKGRKNDYLCSLASDGGMWPTRDERSKMAPAFEALMHAHRTHNLGIERQVYDENRRTAVVEKFMKELQ